VASSLPRRLIISQRVVSVGMVPDRIYDGRDPLTDETGQMLAGGSATRPWSCVVVLTASALLVYLVMADQHRGEAAPS
jgi:hypothetical protein